MDLTISYYKKPHETKSMKIGMLGILIAAGCLFTSAYASNLDDSKLFQTYGLNYSDVKTFYAKLQDSVIHDKRDVVLQLLSYPFSATVNGKGVVIKSPKAGLKYYDYVFTQKAINSLKDTPFENLEVSYEGVSTPGGIVWFGLTYANGKMSDPVVMRVITINN